MKSTSWETYIRQLSDPSNHLIINALGYSATNARWRLEASRRDGYCVYFVVQHEAKGLVAGTPLKLAAEDCIWLAPGTELSLWNPDPERPVELFHLYFRLQSRGRDLRGLPRAWLLGRGHLLKHAFTEMFNERRDKCDFADHRLRQLLTGLFILLARQRHRMLSGGSALSAAQCAAVEKCAVEHSFRVSLGELAGATRLSVPYFRSLFTQTFGLPPRTWLVRMRVQGAARKLGKSNLTVGEIAELYGYSDIFQFSKQFRVVMGMSPRAYRQSVKLQFPAGSTVEDVGPLGKP